ncbi:J domain-containing protein, partial [bacterium]|nr:J domain-containing protein [bacterium]
MAGFSDEELFRQVNFGDMFSGLNFDFGGHGLGFFDSFLGRRRSAPGRGANLEIEVQVPLSRIATGGEEKVSYTRRTQCTACQGTGAHEGKKLHRCEACEGTGSLSHEDRRKRQQGEVVVRSFSDCKACRGRGVIIEKICSNCSGRGEVEKTETLTVNVPPGVEEGMALRVPGHGHPAAQSGSPPGDLFILIRSRRDPRFERLGADLWRVERITAAEAALGIKRTVPTLDGSAEVTVPPGTQP